MATPNAGNWTSTGTSLRGKGTLAIQFQGGTIASNQTWGDNTTYSLTGTVQVAKGATLTIPEGKVIKANRDAKLEVLGTLQATGTSASPVIFTSIHDDTAGGDTNGNGTATTPAADDWDRIWIKEGSATLSHVQIRHAGRLPSGSPDSAISISASTGTLAMTDAVVQDSFGEGIWIYSGTGMLERVSVLNAAKTGVRSDASQPVTLADVSIQNAGADGLRVNSSSVVTVSNLSIRDVGGFAIVAMDAGKWNSTNTTVSGKGIPFIQFKRGSITDTRIWSDHPKVYLAGIVGVAATGSLEIPAGTIIKANREGRLEIEGKLNIPGTADRPVIFTSIKDDAVGGDTNADGDASQPAAGDWDRIYIKGSAGQATLTHVRILYAGRLYSGSADSSISTSSSNGSLSIANSVIAHGYAMGSGFTAGRLL